jgi:polar amino acid transport system substrate-binding protein
MFKQRAISRILAAVLLILVAAGCGKQDNGENQAAATASGQEQKTGGAKSEQGKALERLKAKGKLTVGVKSDYEPFGYINEKGENAGFEIEMAKGLAKDLFGDPNKVEFVPVNSTNRIPYLQTGKIDLIIATMSVTEDRAKEVAFSDPYFKSGVQLLVKKDSKINDVADLKGKKVIVVPGSTGDLGISKQVPDAELIKLQKTSESVQALKDGRAEAFAQDNTLLYPIAGQNPEFKVVGKPFAELPWAIAIKKGDTDVLNWVNTTLKKWEDEDYFYTMYQQWIAKQMPAEFNPGEFLRRPKNK